MEKTRAKAKTKDKTEWVKIDFECDPNTLKRLNAISKMAHTTLDQTVAVILATYVIDEKQVKKTLSKKAKVNKTTNDFGFGDK